MNPFVLVALAISIGTGIYAANKISPWLTFSIFLFSVGATVWMTVRAFFSGSAKTSNKVNYNKLNQILLTPLAPWIKQNLRGHDAIVDEILASIQEELLLAREGKTLGAYLLVGPTGTGKTFFAHLVAQALFPDSEPVLIHMNQLKHADDVFTLIGPPPGRPGHELGGFLTRPVLENPYRVVIFDEIEKAHPDLRDCLYEVLDTAQCREKSTGKLIDFGGCVFFGTCNAGVESMRTSLSRATNPSQRVALSRDALAETGLDKAFLARWNRIELMDELAPVHVAEVALLHLCKYWKNYGMEISYVPPELLLEAVERNEEFRAYGVRQLATFIRMKTTAVINQARAAKATRVKLDVSPDGQILVETLG